MHRSKSGPMILDHDHQGVQCSDTGVRKVVTRLSESSVKMNVLSETEQFYRWKYQMKRSSNNVDLCRLKCFEMNLRQKVNERYRNSQSRVTDRKQYSPRAHCVSSPNLTFSDTVRVVPCHKVMIRACDEPYQEFRRAGIGACFKGKSRIHD